MFRQKGSALMILIFLLVCVLVIGLIVYFVTLQSKKTHIVTAPLPTQTATSTQTLANPASVYCEKLGGKTEIRQNEEGQYGVCILDGGTECGEWALFRGECDPSDEKLTTRKSGTAAGTTKVGLANPASVNCTKLDGTLTIMKRGDGGEYGLCDLGSGYACEEWALFRGDCPKSGVKTTGFDTDAQKYCAWLGGKTLAVENASCTFDDGSECDDEALFNGLCHKGKY